MKQDKLAKMHEVTHAVYLSEFQKVQGILTEEARLRGELSRLESQAREGQDTLQGDTSMQTMGADMLWKAWVNRTQRQLNMELAQVMARKLTAMDRVRTAFGRQNAVEAMQRAALLDRKKSRQSKALDNMLQDHANR